MPVVPRVERRLLWLHLCNSAYFIRTDDLGWSLDESEIWLREALSVALLDHPRQSDRGSAD
ncbi:hypothetical protein AB0L00_38165 [Actinoallomurus sp. NPDC052308]|uniref:hypothetical protein n=1 Tax=Actinoallomurus sp. NPDC052308 TaxID=3155530 RepID=UPI00343BE8C0